MKSKGSNVDGNPIESLGPALTEDDEKHIIYVTKAERLERKDKPGRVFLLRDTLPFCMFGCF